MTSRLRAILGALVFVTSGVLSACLKSTAPQESLVQLNGSWTYTGEQTGPVRETLTGTLTISRESGTSFQGSLYLLRFNPQSGQSIALEGQVSGSESATDVIDFDADFRESTPRRHVGHIVADTIKGNWIGSSPDGTTSGTFRVERETR